MDTLGIGLSALILSGTMAFMGHVADKGPREWRGVRTADACPAAVIGGCRTTDDAVVFRKPRP